MSTDQITLDRPEAAPDHEKLKDYSRIKLSLASQLRLFRDVLKKRESQHRDGQCEELMVKLAEDRFTLAVLGQFKRGKSSLMNAIIGRELLPTGVLPLTSAITVLRFGPKERLVVEREGLQWPEIAPVSQIEDYVTERGNPGNCKRVTVATVEVPLPFLRRGLEFVDTPGVGSAITANTATTYAFIPRCDAVLFVTSVDSPFTSVELEFLKEIRQHVHKIFFIVNKIDLLAERERREVLEFVAKTIREQMGTDDVRMFPVSCKLALASKVEHDLLAYQRSGLKPLEETLSRFLSEEKTATFLAAVVERANRLVDAEAGEIELAKPAKDLAQTALRQRLDKIHQQWRQLDAARAELLWQLRSNVLLLTRVGLTPEIELLLRAEQERSSTRLDRLLARAGWQPSALLSKRIINHVLRRFHHRTLRWASARVPDLSFADNASCQAVWEQLQTNLGEITKLASVVLETKYSANSVAENLSSWCLEVNFEQPSAIDEPRTAKLSWWLRPLPARMVRPLLKNQLQREIERLTGSCKWVLLAAIQNQVNAALDELRDAVNNRAAEIETRIEKTMTGDLESNDAALASIRQTLLALRGEILHLPSGAESVEEPPTMVTEPLAGPAPTAPVESDLATDLRTRGCSVCDHLQHVAFAFFSHWQYALSSDETAQAEFAAELGFCPLHAWQLEAVSSPVGSSVGYPKLAERIARLLAEAAKSQPAEKIVGGLARSPRDCRVCRRLRAAEQDYIARLAAFVNDPQGRDTYARSHGACLRHLALLIASSSDDQLIRFLLHEAARRFEEASEDMQAFAMKTEALRRALRNEDEEDAYLRTIAHLVGSRSVWAPWPNDVEI